MFERADGTLASVGHRLADVELDGQRAALPREIGRIEKGDVDGLGLLVKRIVSVCISPSSMSTQQSTSRGLPG